MNKDSQLDSALESFFTDANEVLLYENIFDDLIVIWSKERTVAVLQFCPNTVSLGGRVAILEAGATTIRGISESERDEIYTLVNVNTKTPATLESHLPGWLFVCSKLESCH